MRGDRLSSDASDVRAGRSSTGTKVFIFVFPALFALVTRILLGSSINIFVIWVLQALVLGGAIAIRQSTTRSLVPRVVFRTALAIAAVLLLIGIVITPYASYTEWFDTFRSGTTAESASVSDLFVLVVAFLVTIVAPGALSMGVVWPVIAIAPVMAFLFAVIYQTPLTFIVAAATCAFLVLYGLNRRRSIDRPGLIAYPVVLTIATLGVAAAVSQVPSEGARWFVDTQLSPALRRSVLSFDPDFPLLYDFSRAAKNFKEKDLGGSPTLTSKPILEVQGRPGETVYVRTSVLDHYNGKAWTMSDGILAGVQANRRFLARRTVGESVMRVTPLVSNLDLLPMTLDTSSVVYPANFPRVVEGNVDTGFRLETPIPKGTTILLNRDEAAEPSLPNWLRPYYLQIPTDMPPELNTIASGLSQETSSVNEVLENISLFLAYNYSYNITPEEEYYRQDDDFVYSFLFSPSGGYCVHFATTFIILARLNGIPARYATGYLGYIPNDRDTTTITELGSHAWPEVWIDGRGWVTWEATTAVEPDAYLDINGRWTFQFNMSGDQNTARQLQGILGREVSATADGDAARGPSIPVWAIVAAIVAAAALATAIVLARRGVVRLFLKAHDRFYFDLRYLAIYLSRRGYPHPSKVGWVAWGDRVGADMNGHAHYIETVRHVAIRNIYAGDPIGAEDAEQVRSALKAVRKSLGPARTRDAKRPAGSKL